MKRSLLWFLAALLCVGVGALIGCGGDDDDDDDDDTGDDDTDDDDDTGDDDTGDDDDEEFTFGSSAFEDGDTLPNKFTCDTKADYGISPPLFWENPPEGTVAYAVTLYDTDVDFGHWGLINIPADTLALDEGISPGGTLPGDAFEVLNDFGNVEYDGPCPPEGETHTYQFKLWALSDEIEDTKSDLCVHTVLPLLEAVAIQTLLLSVTFGM